MLGPLLFLVYTADLHSNLENALINYADDSTLVAAINNPNCRASVAASLNRDLARIQEWCSFWNMKLNHSKTSSLVVSRSRDINPHPHLVIGHNVIADCSTLKILGVLFDSKLIFESHLRAIAASASQKLGLVRKASTIFGSSSVSMTCFRSFILPFLEYCSPVWISAAPCHLKLLDSVANRARYFFSDLSSFNLDHRRMVSTLCMFRKIFFSDDHPLSCFIPPLAEFVRETRASNVAHQYTLVERRCNSNQYKRSFIPRTVAAWNKLPSSCFGGSLKLFKGSVNRLDCPCW